MRIIGIGTDITEIDRVAALAVKHQRSFLERVYTPAELAYCGTGKKSGERLAARWAAKEAVLKALGTGWIEGISWTDVEVCTLNSGQPTIRLSGGALKTARGLGVSEVQISLSHCREYAVAYAAAVGE